MYRKCAFSQDSRVCQFMMKMMGKQFGKLKRLEEISARSIEFMKSCECNTVAPTFFPDMKKKGRSGHFSQLKFHVMQDAVVSAHASQVLVGNFLGLSDYLLRNMRKIPPISTGVVHYEKGFCIYNPEIDREIEKGIFVDGDGSFNWFHFVLECLPKAYASEMLPDEFSDYPLIVPPNCKGSNTFREALDLFKGKRQIVFLEKGQRTRVRSLVYIDDVSSSPFNMFRRQWPMLEDYSQHDVFLRDFINKFRIRTAGFEDGTGQNTRRVFLARSGPRRQYNQDDLVEISRKYGFTVASPENMTLKQQAEFFSKVEFVIGASGAAWTNLLFMNPSVKGLTWLPPEYAEFCSYATLANLLGQELLFVSAQPETPLDSTGAAYAAEYTVDPKLFEAALGHMLGHHIP